MNEDVSKTVRFNNTVRIILIPYKQDFIEEQGSVSLWWSREELRKISYRIRFEIMSYAHHEDIPLKEAAKKLYGLKW